MVGRIECSVFEMEDTPKQFVIQQHTTPNGVHWDLMLEMGECLWTWRLNVPPVKIKNKPITAERIHDHPLRFLTYEGPVQNNTGTVTIADKGTYLLRSQTDSVLMLELQGTILSDCFQLQRTENTLWVFEIAVSQQ